MGSFDRRLRMATDCSWCQYLNRSKTRRMKDDKSTDNIDDSPFIRSDVRCPHPKMRRHQQLIDCERVLNTLVHSIRSFEKLFDCCGCQRLRPRVQDDPQTALILQVVLMVNCRLPYRPPLSTITSTIHLGILATVCIFWSVNS
jgi:hypothetical protein